MFIANFRTKVPRQAMQGQVTTDIVTNKILMERKRGGDDGIKVDVKT